MSRSYSSSNYPFLHIDKIKVLKLFKAEKKIGNENTTSMFCILKSYILLLYSIVVLCGRNYVLGITYIQASMFFHLNLNMSTFWGLKKIKERILIIHET